MGLVSALTALVIYVRKGHLQLDGSGWFLAALALGTYWGSKLTLVLPVSWFTWFLVAVCPLILYITLKRDGFITQDRLTEPSAPQVLFFLGLVCGIYDGAFGPGGGTFMFLSLALWGGFSVLAAIATSKLANTISAGVSLGSFAWDDAVVWSMGLPFAVFSFVGALLGAHFASQKAKLIVRPVLVFVVLLLLARLLFLSF